MPWQDSAAAVAAGVVAVVAAGVLVLMDKDKLQAWQEERIEGNEEAAAVVAKATVGMEGNGDDGGEDNGANTVVWFAALLASMAGLVSALIAWLTIGGRLQERMTNRLFEDGGAMIVAARERAAYHNARAMDELRARRARGDFSAQERVHAAGLTLAGTVLNATARIRSESKSNRKEQAQQQRRGIEVGGHRAFNSNWKATTASGTDRTATDLAVIELALDTHMIKGASVCVLRGSFAVPQKAVEQATSAAAAQAATSGKGPTASPVLLLKLGLDPDPEARAYNGSRDSTSTSAASGCSDDGRVRVTANFVDDAPMPASLGATNVGGDNANGPSHATGTYTCVIRPPAHDDSSGTEGAGAAAATLCTVVVHRRAGSMDAVVRDHVLVDRHGDAYDIVASIDQTREGKCLICWDTTACVVFLPCRHLVCCAACAEDKASTRSCPACRRPVQQLLHTRAAPEEAELGTPGGSVGR